MTSKLLSDRRGSRAWKVTTATGHLALKANNPEADETRDKAAELAQEDRHLLQLAEAGALNAGYRIDAGPWTGGRWLAVQWIDGVPVRRAFALARGPEGDRPSVRPWLLTIARTWAARLARMHAAEWTHADVQPTNTLITGQGAAEVIDFTLSCGPDTANRIPYRGAITHITSPEVAAAILATPDTTHVQVPPASDVWGLGASLFWCWTGYRPASYADEAPRPEKLREIATGRTLDLAAVRPWEFPKFETLIRACLDVDPGGRPTAAEVAAW
ncbi:protein kinase [Streptomyces sp. NPDC050743]|uniref:protein kinase domain-containing protein n=1 Tax=Streptomyces sp. NPDC050743 TaxID=3365634 RepID=UPI0037A35461